MAVAPEQKYKVIDKLDSGGMAEVYRAEAHLIQGLKKKVAIKRILPHLTKNEKFISMFLDEARLSLWLHHANIVQVFDIGRSGSTYFIVMEYVDGINLRKLCESVKRQGRTLDISHSVFIVMEVCKGLGYAHDMTGPDDDKPLGIVHRDVSPPNILLSLNGEVKLVDFGLAKAASQLEQTDPGVVKGKFSYLSPEAASGQPVAYHADIFACGIILYELLTSRRLFYGETDYQTVELVRKAEIPSIVAINPAIPPELEAITLRALARDPEDRFQHAYEMQDALAQFLFSRRLKVTSRDLAQLVRSCVTEQSQVTPTNRRPQGVIDTLIREEIVKFTSLDSDDFADVGSQPLSPDELEGDRALNPSDFVDPRNWSNEVSGQQRKSQPTLKGPTETSIIAPLEKMLEGEEAFSEIELTKPPPSSSKSNKALWISVAIVVVLGAVAGGAFYYFKRLKAEEIQNKDITQTRSITSKPQ